MDIFDPGLEQSADVKAACESCEVEVQWERWRPNVSEPFGQVVVRYGGSRCHAKSLSELLPLLQM